MGVSSVYNAVLVGITSDLVLINYGLSTSFLESLKGYYVVTKGKDDSLVIEEAKE